MSWPSFCPALLHWRSPLELRWAYETIASYSRLGLSIPGPEVGHGWGGWIGKQIRRWRNFLLWAEKLRCHFHNFWLLSEGHQASYHTLMLLDIPVFVVCIEPPSVLLSYSWGLTSEEERPPSWASLSPRCVCLVGNMDSYFPLLSDCWTLMSQGWGEGWFSRLIEGALWDCPCPLTTSYLASHLFPHIISLSLSLSLSHTHTTSIVPYIWTALNFTYIVWNYSTLIIYITGDSWLWCTSSRTSGRGPSPSCEWCGFPRYWAQQGEHSTWAVVRLEAIPGRMQWVRLA